MKKKWLVIVLFLLFALPLPVALIGFLLSLLWFLTSLLSEQTPLIESITAFFGMAIGITYLFTYVFALTKTCLEKKLSIKSFLPLGHCLIALLFLLSLKPIATYISNTTEHFGFTKKEFSVMDELDTHGGFLGDGSYYLILDCSGNKEKALELIKDWKKLPLSEPMNVEIFGGFRDDGVVYDQGLVTDANIPNIKNGYYLFEDRHSESKDTTNESELFQRASLNFSIAFYDCDTDIMYYFEYDT